MPQADGRVINESRTSGVAARECEISRHCHVLQIHERDTCRVAKRHGGVSRTFGETGWRDCAARTESDLLLSGGAAELKQRKGLAQGVEDETNLMIVARSPEESCRAGARAGAIGSARDCCKQNCSDDNAAPRARRKSSSGFARAELSPSCPARMNSRRFSRGWCTRYDCNHSAHLLFRA